MAGKKDLLNIWKNIQELDLRPIRDTATRKVTVALVGPPGAGKRTLATQLGTDPARPATPAAAPCLVADLENASPARAADLIILLLDATAPLDPAAAGLLRQWLPAGKKIIVFYNKLDLLGADHSLIPWLETGPAQKIYGSAHDKAWLQRELVPLILSLLPEHHLALGRTFPFLRETIARTLINDTCFANAAYAVGTGLAEIIPVLDLPLNITDMVILTKAQALLVYKLGLALGLSTDWQYYVAEFGSVIGGGFLWRQLARQLIGLIPVWGIVPKVAVAYSGTYVVGHIVLQWYLTGRHLPKEKIRQLSGQAFTQGKNVARSLIRKLPLARRPLLRRPKTPAALLAPPDPPPAPQACPACQTPNDPDARYCKHCAQPL